ncbi:MAG: branched-chain amino acid ABC transporter permease [Armatimonadota bacterium]|nr:branched-chain amino acid ABC transporter permease [Armatimonadota bacterium]MDR7447853.1 branched-chain amino acid ABC transporter permease [Armatimonadota bacterium]MDR7479798.1 branched-chain amino acid ABC transporter permease [Armatimonadota bacterium]MDR7487539.1 branched-chain amino acid ABC transporter permease [Armatimonadota bacterium]MDR7490276.1 branched-chain amino acid ABC transporter permease [Armatimonadota bacterium]
MRNEALSAAPTGLRALLQRPPLAMGLLTGYILGTSLLVANTPRSLLFFLLFLVSLLLIFAAEVPRWFKGAAVLVTLGLLMPLLGLRNGFYLEVATQVGIFVALALGLNIVVGLAGLLDLGYVAFYAVGAYSWAILGSPQLLKTWPALDAILPLGGWWFFVFLLLAVVLAAITGVLLGLPVLRLRGDYLAIVTLGFGEVIRVLANNLDKPINLTNGPIGITPITRPAIEPVMWVLRLAGVQASPAAVYPVYFYFLVLVVVLLVILVTQRFKDSHIGRAWEAIREDEEAAIAMGVPLVRMKLLAFAAGASFAGAMGVIFASKQYFINPESFTFLESIGVLAMVILGGMGSIPGAILGATTVTILNLQVLKQFSLTLNAWKNAGVTILGYNLANLPPQLEPAKYERMVFGIILILMMIFRPQGIIPSRRRRMELEEAQRRAAETTVEAGVG